MTNKEKDNLQKEIVDSLPKNPYGRLILSPRLGKTKIAIDIIKANNPESILWVTPLAELANVEIPSEFITWKAKKYIKRLTTITWASLGKLKGDFEMVIFDEEQYITENNSAGFYNGNITCSYIISMTGTSSTNEDKQRIYKEFEFPILYQYDLDDAVNADLLADYTINVIKVPLSKDYDIPAGNAIKKFMTSEEKQYDYLSKQVATASYKTKQFKVLARMRAIYNSKSKEKIAKSIINNSNGRKLIFSASIDQANRLSPYTYHSKTTNKYLREFIGGTVDSLALVNAGGTGVTYRGIDHLFILQADSDKNGLTSQKIARTLLKQGKNYKAKIWLFCLQETQDEIWVKSTLKRFNPDKINTFYVSRTGEIIGEDNQNLFLDQIQ